MRAPSPEEQEAAIQLADAALALLNVGKSHPVILARRAYRAEADGTAEQAFVQSLMLYHKRKERHST